MKTICFALVLAGATALFPTAPVRAQDSGGIAIDLGQIRVSSALGTIRFVVDDRHAGADTSWGGISDEDRSFRMVGLSPDGAELSLSVEYEDSAPFVWLYLTRRDAQIATGGTSEGMSVTIDTYTVLPAVDGGADVMVRGRFSGPLRDDAGLQADVTGSFEAELPRVAFSITPPDPD